MTYREAMRYEVHAPNPDGSVERFFIDREERLRKGDVIEQMTSPTPYGRSCPVRMRLTLFSKPIRTVRPKPGTRRTRSAPA